MRLSDSCQINQFTDDKGENHSFDTHSTEYLVPEMPGLLSLN